MASFYPYPPSTVSYSMPTIRLLGFVPLSAERGDVVPGTDGRSLGPEAMTAFRRHRHPGLRTGTEAGGILLGRYLIDAQAIIVDEVTEPAPGDGRLPRAFHRLDDHHVRTIKDRWDSSDGRINYLGEWHTHAEPRPTPSPLDIATWRDTLREVARQHGDAWLLFAIAGQAHVGVWEGRHV